MDQTAAGKRRSGKWWEGEKKYPRRQAVETVEFSGPCRPHGREERPRTGPRAHRGGEIQAAAGGAENSDR